MSKLFATVEFEKHGKHILDGIWRQHLSGFGAGVVVAVLIVLSK